MPGLSAAGEERSALPRARIRYLVGRLAEAVTSRGASPAERQWVASLLRPAEFDLWLRLFPLDQSHAISSAREVERRLMGTPFAGEPLWLAAALLHDVGKGVAGLGPAPRVAATLLGRVVSLATARRWARGAPGARRRLGLYLTHGPAGAEAIRQAGGREEIAAWAEVHQSLPCPEVAGIPGPVVAALSESDLE